MSQCNWKGLSRGKRGFFRVKRKHGVMRKRDFLPCDGMKEGELHGGKLMIGQTELPGNSL